MENRGAWPGERAHSPSSQDPHRADGETEASGWGSFVLKVLALLSASDAGPAPGTLPILLLPRALGTQGPESRVPGLDPPCWWGLQGASPHCHPWAHCSGSLGGKPGRGRPASMEGKTAGCQPSCHPGGEKSIGLVPTLRALPWARAVGRGGRWAPRKGGVWGRNFDLLSRQGRG